MEKQPKMRDTVWNRKVQKLQFIIGVPKDLKERGRYHEGMKLEEMRAELASHNEN